MLWTGPGLVDNGSVGMGEFLSLSLITFCALALTFALIVMFAGQLRKILNRPDRLVSADRVLAVMVGGSGARMVPI